MTREQIEQQIHAIEKQIEVLQKDLDTMEVSDFYDEDDFEEFLNDETVSIGNLTYGQGDVLKSVDPTAFRCAYNDHLDTLDIEDFDAYTDVQSEIEELESELEDLQEQLEELEEDEAV
jgi:chaperonin cofactor prefoldin